MQHQPIGPGDKAPAIVNLIMEIQKGGGRNKYEFDKETGYLTLDRVNATSLGYPADYGFIPGTLCEDSDPLDALLVIDEPLHPMTVVRARPIGVLYMVDEGEGDEKLVCVAADDVSKTAIKELADLESNFQKRVEHFYSHYKDWKNDWRGVSVKFNGWGDSAAAQKAVTEAVQRARQPAAQ